MLTRTTLRTHHTRETMDPASLATEPLKPLLFRLALPTVTAQLINMLYNIVDRIYIGHIHRNSVCDAISKNPCQRTSNQKSKKNVTLMTRLSP
jgi:hypothetical protein